MTSPEGGPAAASPPAGGGPAVVAIGGGHGLAATLRAVRRYTDRVTAVVSVADDGGSSGRLRELLGIVPPGDLRKCLVALAAPGSRLAAAFEYRFADDELAGHSLGNLLLAGLMDGGDPIAALDEAGRLLGTRGRVLPATCEPVTLKAEAECGSVAGQVAVMGTDRIRTVSLVPSDPAAPAEVVEALADAEQVVLGPGSLFTSVLAALVVPAVREGVAASAAETVYVCNLRPQVPETQGFDVGRHVEALATHGVAVDRVVCDTTAMALGSVPVPVIDVPLARPNGLAHDPERLGAVLAGLAGS
ncbi:MAG TPA: uridine diphosphate-N-acetylglucosamine-binding protein YvcK [Acidimicrobiales bacterium]|nr:uridine diphosphate-N-acetylglucosamine-binding protein YvcK [Acidimicrobiales bacterium]